MTKKKIKGNNTRARVNTSRQFHDAHKELRDRMQFYLRQIGYDLVDQVIKNYKALPQSKRMDAIKNIAVTGHSDYKRAILSAFGVIASEALDNVRKEVPKAKNVKLDEGFSLALGDFNSLPAAIQTKIRAQYATLSDDQLNSIVRTVKFQYGSSVDSTDSVDVLTGDLTAAIDDFVEGASVNAGAGAMSAQIINDTRNEYLDSDEVQEQLDGFEFVNADPVSEICTDLAGTVFAVDDPDRFRYTPPLHFNCKSYIAPILKGDLDEALSRNKQDGLEKLQPSTKEIADSIQFAEKRCSCTGHFLKLGE